VNRRWAFWLTATLILVGAVIGLLVVMIVERGAGGQVGML
jgi:hypothetical protein